MAQKHPTTTTSMNVVSEQAEDLFTEEEHARLNTEIPQYAIESARVDFHAYAQVVLKSIIRQLGSSGTEEYETYYLRAQLIQSHPTLRNMLSEGLQSGNFNAARRLSKDNSLFTPCTL